MTPFSDTLRMKWPHTAMDWLRGGVKPDKRTWWLLFTSLGETVTTERATEGFVPSLM